MFKAIRRQVILEPFPSSDYYETTISSSSVSQPIEIDEPVENSYTAFNSKGQRKSLLDENGDPVVVDLIEEESSSSMGICQQEVRTTTTGNFNTGITVVSSTESGGSTSSSSETHIHREDRIISLLEVDSNKEEEDGRPIFILPVTEYQNEMDAYCKLADKELSVDKVKSLLKRFKTDPLYQDHKLDINQCLLIEVCDTLILHRSNFIIAVCIVPIERSHTINTGHQNS